MLCNTLLNNRIQYSLRYQLLEFSNNDIDIQRLQPDARYSLITMSELWWFCPSHLITQYNLSKVISSNGRTTSRLWKVPTSMFILVLTCIVYSTTLSTMSCMSALCTPTGPRPRKVLPSPSSPPPATSPQVWVRDQAPALTRVRLAIDCNRNSHGAVTR